MKDIIDFLTTHPAIKPTEIEREAELPTGTLKLFLLGKKLFPGKHLPKLENVLMRYGFQPPERLAEKKKKTASRKLKSKK